MRNLWRNYGLSLTDRWAVPRQLGAPDVDGLGGVPVGAALARPDAGGVRAGRLRLALGQSTFENWQSEFLQIFAFIVLTTFLVHKHSHESPDVDFETEASLRRIEARLAALEAAQTQRKASK